MKSIPTFALFGEQSSQQDWIHWETIPARSRLHGFHITPHRHENLTQILFVETGSAEAQFDGRKVSLKPGDMVFIPALVVHEYAFSPDVDGLVVTFFDAHSRAAGFSADTALTASDSDGALKRHLLALIAEVQNPGPRHALVSRAHLTLLLAGLERASVGERLEGQAMGRSYEIAKKFRAQVEENFRQSRSVSGYAEEIGVSHTHLNRVCNEIFGASAQDVVNRRVVTEARRYLLFSDLPIKAIGGELGFDDPAYFTRFLTRHLKQSPMAFRAERIRAT